MRKVCAVMWCIVGSEDDATRLLAPVHDVGTPLLHGVGAMPHPALQSLFDGLYTKGLQCYWRADFVNELSDEADREAPRVGRRSSRRCTRRCTCTRSTARRTTSPPTRRRSALATRSSPR